MRRISWIGTFLWIFLFGQNLLAQENDSYVYPIQIEFHGGMPLYWGDFFTPFGVPQPYFGFPLDNTIRQYNVSTVGGGLILPYNNYLALRLRASYHTIYFSEPQAVIHFKNNAFDASALVQFRFLPWRFGMYTLLGGGYNTHFDATLWNNRADMENRSNTKRLHRFSTTGGLGMDFKINENLAIFAEADVTLLGSDRFDGWNGQGGAVTENEKEKNYFQSDKILSARGGIRFTIRKLTRQVKDRPVLDPVSSFLPDPDEKQKEPKEVKPKEPKDDWPEIYKKLGIQKKLKGYTLQVHYALNLDEVVVQKDFGEKLVAELSAKTKSKVELQILKEAAGYSIHVGGFKTYAEAKNHVRSVRRYYAGAIVKRHL